MQATYSTIRLKLDTISLQDSLFILELVNQPEWKQFIGDRNVHSVKDAEAYINNILYSQHLHFWVVRLKTNNTPIGIVTLIKRDYLEHHDIGFAMLSQYGKMGYAYEAASVVLDSLFQDPVHKGILATTMKANTNSIKLLKKLGMQFLKQIVVEGEDLLLFEITQNQPSHSIN
jgi:[ribosomal protein S5]-alanine N-acetyltransferase